MKINSLNISKTMPNKFKSHDTINFGYRPTMNAELEIYPNTRESFVNNVSNAIMSFPDKYKNILQNHDYSITVTPSLNTAILMRGIATPISMPYEKNYFKNSFHTQINYKNNKNIIIADIQPYSNNYTKNLVYFALSSALVETLNRHKQTDILEALYKDTLNFNYSGHFDKLNSNEKMLLTEEILDSNGKVKPLEVVADLIAWNLGAGKYGSGLYGVYDAYFTRKIFPHTNAILLNPCK